MDSPLDNPRLYKAKLSQSGVHCTLDWVTGCLQWLREEQPGLSQAQTVVRLQEQWSWTDITEQGVTERPVLPPNLASEAKL